MGQREEYRKKLKVRGAGILECNGIRDYSGRWVTWKGRDAYRFVIPPNTPEHITDKIVASMRFAFRAADIESARGTGQDGVVRLAIFIMPKQP